MRTSKVKKESKYQPKLQRKFSNDFKRLRVREIEDGLATVRQISRAYRISSTAVYKWLKKYSSTIQPGERIVVELESEAARTLALQKRNEELERVIGQKQLQIDYYERLIVLASEELSVDIKKNFYGKCFSGTKPIERKAAGR